VYQETPLANSLRVNRTALFDESPAINRGSDRNEFHFEGCGGRKAKKSCGSCDFARSPVPIGFSGCRQRDDIRRGGEIRARSFSGFLSLSLSRISLRRDIATRGWPWSRVYRHIHPTLRRRSLVDEELATLVRGYKNVIVRRTHGALHVEAKSTRARPSRIVTSLARTPLAFQTSRARARAFYTRGGRPPPPPFLAFRADGIDGHAITSPANCLPAKVPKRGTSDSQVPPSPLSLSLSLQASKMLPRALRRFANLINALNCRSHRRYTQLRRAAPRCAARQTVDRRLIDHGAQCPRTCSLIINSAGAPRVYANRFDCRRRKQMNIYREKRICGQV